MERFQNIKGKAFLFLMLLWFLWFMNFSVRTIFSPLMPLIEDEFVIGHARASSLFGFTSFGYGISLILSGLFSGSFGYKRSIVVSMVVSSCAFFLVPYIKVFSLLSLVSFVLGMCTGIYIPSVIPLITEYYEEKTWGKAIAIHDTAASLSIFSAPFIAFFFLKFLQWREIFNVFGVVFIICIVVFSLKCREVKVKNVSGDSIRSLLGRKPLWLMGITWIFMAGASLGLYFVIPLYLTKELFLDVAYANKIFGLSRLGGVFVTIMTGFIVDRFSLKKITFFVVLITGIFTLLIASGEVRFIKVFLFLQASIVMGFFPVGLVSISRVFEKEHRSMATGLIVTLATIFGMGITPFLLGLSGDLLSFRFGIFLLGVLVILSSGITYFLKELD
jgi:NNP family nitrate/nitrite transporter-like MFS transporter